MIQEEYVSLKTAKLLKEKGFNIVCFGYYNQEKVLEKYSACSLENTLKSPFYFDCILAPTQSLAMRWLREVYNLHVDSSIYIDTDGDSEYEYTYTYWDWLIFNSESGRRIAEPQIGCGRYDSYEEACEAGIKYCLENLIK